MIFDQFPTTGNKRKTNAMKMKEMKENERQKRWKILTLHIITFSLAEPYSPNRTMEHRRKHSNRTQ